MAEIRSEKKSTSMWTWVTPALLVAGVLGCFFGRGPGDRDLTNAQTDTRSDSAAAYSSSSTGQNDSSDGTVAGFTAFVADNSASRGENQQHPFTAESFRRLSKVLDGAIPGNSTTTSTATFGAASCALPDIDPEDRPMR
jgi:hypothetical protein